MYDVAIIGAGPAGAILARLMGGRYKVLLIEKRQLPDWSENFSSLKSFVIFNPILRKWIMNAGLQSIRVRKR